MRLRDLGKVFDHDLLVKGPHDHHPQGAGHTVIINAQAVAGLTAYEKRIDLGRSGYKTLRGFLRGPQNIGNQGHTGCFFLASDVSAAGIGMSNTYSTVYYVYMGAFSRLHGDSYLSENEFGDDLIVLRDAYIDDDEAVLEFYNRSTLEKTLTAYGTVMVK
jgi:hypothetical protein